MIQKIKALFKVFWARVKYEFYYPRSSENPDVQRYLAAIDVIVGNRRSFFSPSERRVVALAELCERIRNDETLTGKETDALLQKIAWPGWFPVEK